MLEALRSIVDQVARAESLREVLDAVVHGLPGGIGADTCSVYLVDPDDGQFVLRAAFGLEPGQVDAHRLAPGTGLVSAVAEKREPVNLQAAHLHPDYRLLVGTGEEQFPVFLAVPIIHYRQLLGVLVVRRREGRAFASDEQSFVVTAAAQIAGAVRGADLEARIERRPARGQVVVTGVAAAPGFAVGTIAVPGLDGALAAVPDREVERPESEVRALRDAFAAVQAELQESSLRLSGKLPGEARAVLEVHALMAGDEALVQRALHLVRHGRQWAPAALRDSIEEYASRFESLEDEYLRARAEDIRTVGQRVLMRLQARHRAPMSFPPRAVLVGDEIPLELLAEFSEGQLAAIVCRRGSSLSHVAVVARGLGIPAVMGLEDLPVQALAGRVAAVDGYSGRVVVDPTSSVRAEIEQLARDELALNEKLEALRDLPARTRDEKDVELLVNIGLTSDVERARSVGASGIGLWRTELEFMLAESFPGESEQRLRYREVLEALAPYPVTMRTLDIGGDKRLAYFPVEEENPFLGWRGIRVSLSQPQILIPQVRAMLAANQGLGNLRILLPMVSTVGEAAEARRLVTRAWRQLHEEGYVEPLPPVGIMLEVPAAASQIERLSEHADFFSIGSNDLTQFLVAADRGNPRVAALCDPLHPGVLRVIRDVIERGRAAGRAVGVCGEMAGDPGAALLLIGMGVDQLSMSPARVPIVKAVVRAASADDARELVAKALDVDGADSVRALLESAVIELGLQQLVFPATRDIIAGAANACAISD